MTAQNATEIILPVKPGETLGGKYRIEQVLGEGGMGVVYVAEHVELRENVAIKVLHPRRASDPEIVRRFLREGRTAVKIRSEHVARVLDVGTHDTGHLKLPYIVMELLEGQDLAHRIDSGGALSIPLAVDLVFQTCEALACAHALGTVHRDLKPSNLFLIEGADGKPFVKVLDFGISKVSDAKSPDSSRAVTTTSDVLGSPGYMSPEQMRATRDVDARSDVWSLGMILWEMLVGRPMFGSATFPEICAKVLHGNLVKPTDAGAKLPQGLEAVIMRALATEPDARHPTVLALAEALGPFLDGDAAPRVARVANLSRPPSDRRHTSNPPPALGVGSTIAATPVDAKKETPKPTTAAATPFSMADPTTAKNPPSSRPTRSSRWPLIATVSTIVAMGIVVTAYATRKPADEPFPIIPTRSSPPATQRPPPLLFSATAPDPVLVPGSLAPSVTTIVKPPPTPVVTIKPTVTASAPPTSASSSTTAPNGAPIIR